MGYSPHGKLVNTFGSRWKRKRNSQSKPGKGPDNASGCWLTLKASQCYKAGASSSRSRRGGNYEQAHTSQIRTDSVETKRGSAWRRKRGGHLPGSCAEYGRADQGGARTRGSSGCRGWRREYLSRPARERA